MSPIVAFQRALSRIWTRPYGLQLHNQGRLCEPENHGRLARHSPESRRSTSDSNQRYYGETPASVRRGPRDGLVRVGAHRQSDSVCFGLVGAARGVTRPAFAAREQMAALSNALAWLRRPAPARTGCPGSARSGS